jgi:hypothetical protein
MKMEIDEIHFKGKHKELGHYVYGDLIHGRDGKVYIDTKENEVIPETVGQYTGMKDKRDNRIYNKDEVKINTLALNHKGNWIEGKIIFSDGCFDVKFNEPVYDIDSSINRTKLYLKCFTVNDAVKIIK